VLAEIAQETSGEAVRANLALAENNARLAAEIATRID
jgi:pseudouridine-5'-phosphate glycosidase